MNTNSFENRHIGINENDVKSMLKKVNVNSIDELIDQTIPKAIRLNEELKVGAAQSEFDYLKNLKEISKKNKSFDNYIGQGYYGTITPSVIKRNILCNPGWYTAYTPYQAEIAQGRLEALLNFQTVITELTGMELANASLLDEATAAAESMLMFFHMRSRAQVKSNANKFFIAEKVFKQNLQVMIARAEPLDIEIIIGDPSEFELNDEFFGSIVQYPNAFGEIEDYSFWTKKSHDIGLPVSVIADIMSLVLLPSPGSWGADVVVGSTQRFGVPMGYGGPHAAFFACKESHKRFIPGRIIGVSMDNEGNPALRMALQTREQHIKRGKATSNICTAQALLAVMASMYAVFHGPEGLKFIAKEIRNKSHQLKLALEKAGIDVVNNKHFDTISIKDKVDVIKKHTEKSEINIGFIDDHATIAIDETTSWDMLDKLCSVLEKSFNVSIQLNKEELDLSQNDRNDDFLSQKVFNSYHSETEMMRYIKRLENKDLSLTHAMISLGSCTMKLNAATEMEPITWPEFANLHPFTPVDQTQGYQQIFKELEKDLCNITGFSGMSLQPNSGAQGEYAGLMVIRAYHLANNDHNRKICLIPNSAHGTNPASAVMAGMNVVIVKCDESGNIDVNDLRAKAEENSDNLAALMITYPSTHGVFEESIIEITGIIHENGGQVYMDGANMNAQVGLTSPKLIGADVCHLNLHKTFSIPHGGGGPGVGPICVAEHLKDFLPSNPIIPSGGKYHIDAISSAPWGSALVCLISYGYIRMLGKLGVKNSTEIAIVNANYMKTKLEKNFKILYSGENGRSAHEFIIDCREFKKYNIEVVDIAKRLIDYGFHAPTVSFPVPGTMMIEPTESENLNEINRFCEALNSIYSEITSNDESDREMLRNSPHTLKMLTSSEWNYEYSREEASFPKNYLKANKFWPSVRRVDEAYGDRNLICSCPPIETYQ